MNRFASQIAAISEIQEQLSSLLIEENFEELNKQLEQRLLLLKQLDVDIRKSSASQTEIESYHSLLVDIQAQDEQQLPKVLKAKGDAAQSSLKASKSRTAVNLYQDISKR